MRAAADRHRTAVLKGVHLTRADRAQRLRVIVKLKAQGRTLAEIGALLGITAERVRQLVLPKSR